MRGSLYRKTFNIRMTKRYMSTVNSDIIGLIGCGKMGTQIAKNLSLNGLSIIAYDIDKTRLQSLDSFSNNITTTNNVDTIPMECDKIISILPNDKILNQVMMGDNNNGIISKMKSNSIHLSMSTISPKTSQFLWNKHKELNQIYITAPIFGRPEDLPTCNAMIPVSGCDISTYESIGYILNNIGNKMYYCGNDASKASVIKLCGNYLMGSVIQSMSEAMLLSEKNGLNRTELYNILTDNGNMFDCDICKGFGKRVCNRDHKPYKDGHFSLNLGKKDVDLVTDLARDSGVIMPFGNVLKIQHDRAVNEGFGDLDWGAIELIASKDAGIDIDTFVYNLKT